MVLIVILSELAAASESKNPFIGRARREENDFGFHQTWEWDGIDWHKRTFATVPVLHGTATLAYDARRARVVMIDL